MQIPPNIPGVIFSPAAAQRIVDGIKKLENTKPRLPDDRPQVTETSFWAMLLGCDIWGRAYSWIKVYPDLSTEFPDIQIPATRSRWKFAEPFTMGDISAVEANGNPGTDMGSIVQLTFAGYDGRGVPCYAFHNTPKAERWLIPPHDHRDNQNGNGGFAFSVFHPGTALPQQRWRL